MHFDQSVPAVIASVVRKFDAREANGSSEKKQMSIDGSSSTRRSWPSAHALASTSSNAA